MDHDNTPGEYVHISVDVHLAGVVSIGNGTWSGAGVIVVKPFEKAGAYIGAPARRRKFL